MISSDPSQRKRIAILGSTGSIGTQTLEVVDAYPDRFEIELLSAQNNADLLIRQSRKFHPNVVVIGNEKLYPAVMKALDPLGVKVYCGPEALTSCMEMDSIDLVLSGLVGYAGLQPTIRALQYGKPIALANKETLVVAGELVSSLASEKGVTIYPVDSEHSAIFQCLAGEYNNPIEKVILTASGGPFRGCRLSDLGAVTRKEALKHPNWEMGAKITIDSATLMNKGLEVIEAKWLFGLTPEQVEVIVHPQSIIHSMVQFEDGSIKAQMGLPDMKLPIQYALGYPDRLKSKFPRFNFTDYPSLTFEQPDTKTFRNLALAFDALAQGGNMPCVLNAANEVAVAAFLREEIRFLQMPDIVERCMAKIDFIKMPSYEDYMETDRMTRSKASEFI